MKDKKRLLVVSAGILWFLAFLVGLFTNLNFDEGLGRVLFMIIYIAALVLGVVAGGYAIYRFTIKQGAKGTFVGVLILITLVPLVLSGTCVLTLGGTFLRSLFTR